MVSQRGFSLIELLVVLALLGFLLSLAVPFASSWSNQSKLQDAAQLLQQGIGRTKALALRNHAGMTSDQAAAKLCLKNNKDNERLELKLYQAEKTNNTEPNNTEPNKPAKCYSDDKNLVWQADLPNKVAIEITRDKSNQTIAFTCLAMNNRSLQIELTDSDSCQKGSRYTLSIGDDNEAFTFN